MRVQLTITLFSNGGGEVYAAGLIQAGRLSSVTCFSGPDVWSLVRVLAIAARAKELAMELSERAEASVYRGLN